MAGAWVLTLWKLGQVEKYCTGAVYGIQHLLGLGFYNYFVVVERVEIIIVFRQNCLVTGSFRKTPYDYPSSGVVSMRRNESRAFPLGVWHFIAAAKNCCRSTVTMKIQELRVSVQPILLFGTEKMGYTQWVCSVRHSLQE